MSTDDLTTEPDSSITFLMTDVEGSTRLWEADRGAMREAMALHDAVIEAAVEDAGGVVVKPRGEGDSRFCVFHEPGAALLAASLVQRGLDRVSWPTPSPVRVRAATYTGTAELRDGDYYGPAPNRCARLREMGHGGQVLVGEQTATLLANDPPADLELVPLGSFRLRDVDTPEVVHQLASADLERDFPPLRAAEARGNLPRPLTSFIGRSEILGELADLLAENRMVTIAGSAGVGKTRLAIKLARSVRGRFADGTWYVELSPVSKPAAVDRALIDAIGIHRGPDGRSEREMAMDFVRDKELLLVLDNCEHLLAACAELSVALLDVSEHLRIVTTSREAVSVAGEVTVRAPSMSLPADSTTAEATLQSEAAVLFVERARLVDPAFELTDRDAPHLVRLCRRLDGIPLAIELAAGKVELFSIGEIADRLADRFDLLTGGPRTALERHQTMQAAVQWSYSLLDDLEQRVFRHLGVFVGGFTVDAAVSVCEHAGVAADPEPTDEVISRLLRKSLVARDADDRRRLVLPEMLRSYALDRLADGGEAIEARTAHLRCFLEAAEAAQDRPTDQLERLSADVENLAAALAFAASRKLTEGADLVVDLEPLWGERERFTAAEALEALIAAMPDDCSPRRTKALAALGTLLHRCGSPEAEGRLRQALACAQRLQDDELQARAEVRLALVVLRQGQLPEAEARLDQATTLIAGADALEPNRRDRIRAGIELGRGVARRLQGDLAEARDHFETAVSLNRALGDTKAGVAGALSNLADADRQAGELDLARERFHEALDVFRSIGAAHNVSMIVNRLGAVAFCQGDYDAACRSYREGLELARIDGSPSLLRSQLAELAEAHHARGEIDEALPLYLESQRIAERAPQDRESSVFLQCSLAKLWLDSGDTDQARELFIRTIDEAREAGIAPDIVVQCLAGLAAVLVASEDPRRACQLAAVASAATRELSVPLTPWDEGRFEALRTTLVERLNDADFASAWAAGAELDVERAVALARS